MLERDTAGIETLVGVIRPNKERDDFIAQVLPTRVRLDGQSIDKKPYYLAYLALMQTIIGLQETSGYHRLDILEVATFIAVKAIEGGIPPERRESVLEIANGIFPDWMKKKHQLQRAALRQSGHMYDLPGETQYD